MTEHLNQNSAQNRNKTAKPLPKLKNATNTNETDKNKGPTDDPKNEQPNKTQNCTQTEAAAEPTHLNDLQPKRTKQHTNSTQKEKKKNQEAQTARLKKKQRPWPAKLPNRKLEKHGKNQKQNRTQHRNTPLTPNNILPKLDIIQAKG